MNIVPCEFEINADRVRCQRLLQPEDEEISVQVIRNSLNLWSYWSQFFFLTSIKQALFQMFGNISMYEIVCRMF